MKSVHKDISIIFPIVYIGIELFGVVAAIAFNKSEQVYLIAKIGLEPIFICFNFFNQNIQYSFNPF